ncbi:hypothetical protein [Phocaeicola sartorii]
MELGAGFDETWGKIRWDLVQDLMELGAKFNGYRAQGKNILISTKSC